MLPLLLPLLLPPLLDWLVVVIVCHQKNFLYARSCVIP
jgi:hypothetical protein